MEIKQAKIYAAQTLCVAAIVVGLVIMIGAAVLGIMIIDRTEKTGGITLTGAGVRWVPQRYIPFLLIPLGAGIFGGGVKGLIHLGHARAIVKKRIAKEAVVYERPDSRSLVVTTLAVGRDLRDLEIGKKVVDNFGLEWASVCLSDGREGYILGDLCAYRVLKARMATETLVHKVPDPRSPPFAKLDIGYELEISETDWDTEHTEGVPWVNVWLADGEHGYISRGSKVKWM